MNYERQPPFLRGATEFLGRSLGASSKTKAPARILSQLAPIRHAICRRLCPDLLFNADMSREIDALRVEIERLREVL